MKKAYAEYAFLGEQITVTDAQAEILNYMEEVEQSRYALGLAAQHDLLRIQIEKDGLQDRHDRLQQMRPALSARLCESVGRVSDPELPWPQEMEDPPPLPAVAQVFGRIESANPELAVFDDVIEGRHTGVALARKKGYPEFTIGLEYLSVSRPRQIRPDRPFPSALHGARRLLTGSSMDTAAALTDLYAVANSDEPMSYRSGGDDNISLSISMNLPIWRKRIKAGIAEAKHLEKAAEHSKEGLALALERTARMAVFGVEDARRRQDLYTESLVPKAQQTYESLQTSYALGTSNTNLLDLLVSVNTLLEFELEGLRAVRDLHVAAAELEMLMGGPWNPSQAAQAAQAVQE